MPLTLLSQGDSIRLANAEATLRAAGVSAADAGRYAERAENAAKDVEGVRIVVDNLPAILDAPNQAAAAQEASVETQTAASIAQASAGIYSTTAVGLSATTNGKVFGVPSPNNPESVRLYRNDNGVAVDTGKSIPSAAAVTSEFQTAGRTDNPVSGTATPTAYVFSEPIRRNGSLKTARVWALVAGVIFFKRWTRSGDVLTQVGKDYPLVLQAGLNILTASDFGPIPVLAGELPGFYGRNIVPYTDAVAGSPGVYNPSATGNVSTFTDASATTTLRMEIGFDFEFTSEIQQRIAEVERKTLGLGVPQIIGVTGQLRTGTASPATYAFAPPVAETSRLTEFSVYAMAAGAVLIKVFRMVNATDFVQIGTDVLVSCVLGLNKFTPAEFGDIIIQKGDFVGLYSNNILGYTADASDGYYNTVSGNFSSFTDANGATTTFAIQVRFLLSPLVSSTASVGSEVIFGDKVLQSNIGISGLTATLSGKYAQDAAVFNLAGAVTADAATANYVRVDAIYYDVLTASLGIQKGTERLTTEGPSFFAPEVTLSNRKPLYLIKVVGSAIGETVAVWDVYNGEKLSLAEQLERERRRSRRFLRKTFGKIASKAPLRILGIGDSIMAQQGGGVKPSTAAPNGRYRDAPTDGAGAYLPDGYPSDVVSTVPLFTNVQLGRADDGGGAVHSKFGYIWSLVAEIEKHGHVLGTNLFYDNFAISAESTASLISAGAPTTWLNNAVAYVTAQNVDLVIIGFGMNERGSTATESNLALIVAAFKAAGAEVLLVDCPRPRTGTISAWRYTNQVIRRAAHRLDCAHLPLQPTFDDNNIGAAGLALSDVCEANRINHPGFKDMAAIGRELAKLVMK